MQYTDGIVFVAENPSRALHKVSEIYDRIAFAAVGKYNEFENLRIGGVRYADLRGYTYDRDDVTARGLANVYAQTLGTIFSSVGEKPYEVELIVAEVGAAPEDDQYYRLPHDGSIVDEHGAVAVGGNSDQIGTYLHQRHRDGMTLAEALALAVESLGRDNNGSERRAYRRAVGGRGPGPHAAAAAQVQARSSVRQLTASAGGGRGRRRPDADGRTRASRRAVLMTRRTGPGRTLPGVDPGEGRGAPPVPSLRAGVGRGPARLRRLSRRGRPVEPRGDEARGAARRRSAPVRRQDGQQRRHPVLADLLGGQPHRGQLGSSAVASDRSSKPAPTRPLAPAGPAARAALHAPAASTSSSHSSAVGRGPGRSGRAPPPPGPRATSSAHRPRAGRGARHAARRPRQPAAHPEGPGVHVRREVRDPPVAEGQQVPG